MIFSWLTWFGLLVAGLGWAAPWAAPAPGDDGIAFLLQYAASLDGMKAVSQNMILSGFGIAILGALQTGFGALDRFFGAIARRNAEKAGSGGPSDADSFAFTAEKAVERGKLKDRSFARFADGSVEVETLLGLRRFSSLADAEGFIG